LKGCVRQYHLEIDAKEVTTNFYTEEQAILLFQFEEANQVLKHSLNCLEDCILVVADLESEQIMYKQYDELESMTHRMMESFLIQTQNEYGQFVHSLPEKRYKETEQIYSSVYPNINWQVIIKKRIQ